MTGNDFNTPMLDTIDRRSINRWLIDQYGPDGKVKYTDMNRGVIDKWSGGTLNLQTALFPPKLINHPLWQFVSQRLAYQVVKDNKAIDAMLFATEYIRNKKVVPGKLPNEDWTSYRIRLGLAGNMLKMMGHSTIKGYDGALTEYQILKEKDPAKTAEIVAANQRIWVKKKREAASKKEEYTTRTSLKTIFDKVNFNILRKVGETTDIYGDIVPVRMLPNGIKGTYSDFVYFKEAEVAKTLGKVENQFKYEATEADLKAEGLNDQQIRIYKKISAVSTAAVRYNNEAVRNWAPEGTIVEEVPNHFPRVWSGDFRIWAARYNPDTGKYSAAEAIAIGASNSKQAAATKRWLEKTYGNETYTTKKGKVVPLYEFSEPVIKPRGLEGTVERDAFMELYRNPQVKKTPELAEKLEEYMMESRLTKGFGRFAIRRQNTDGYLGSRLAAQNYWSGEKAGIISDAAGKRRLEKNIHTKMSADFERAVTLYVSGAVKSASRHEMNKWLNDFESTKIHVPIKDGGFKSTTIKGDLPNALQAVDVHKRHIYGDLQEGRLSAAASEVMAKYIGRSGLDKLGGGANKVTLVNKLLFFNARYMAASAIQPYHMLYGKLLDLKFSGMEKGQVHFSMLRSLYDLILPSKEIADAQIYAMERGVTSAKFMEEAMTPIRGFTGLREWKIPALQNLNKKLLGTKTFNFGKLLKSITGQNLTASIEQISRLNAFTILYNFARSAGKSIPEARDLAVRLADIHMTEYTYIEQPGMYGTKGMGTTGKPFGLFKTFSHNYLGQMTNGITKAKTRKGNEYLVGFLAQMIAIGGLFGMFAMQTADDLLNMLSPVAQKITGKPLPSITETVLSSNYPDFVKYGIPSATLGVDLTATLAAPGGTVTDLVSVPALEYWGLTYRGLTKGRGAIPTLTRAFYTAVFSNSPYEKRDAWVKFMQDSFPTSMHAAIEKYYMGIPKSYAYWKEWDLTKENKNIYKYAEYGPVRDVFKKGRGELYRTAADWRARTLTSYSLRERELLKLIYVTTRVKGNIQRNTDGLISAGAQHLAKEGYIPLWLYNELRQFGLTTDQIETKIKNRIKLMDTDFLTRINKRTKSFQGNVRINKLVNDIINRKYLYYGAL